MKILFANPPYWEQHPGEPLRIGIRAGSRWPFTRHTVHAPDAFHAGGYLPFPFFLGHAASCTDAAMPDATVWLRDSIARGESHDAWSAYLNAERPDWIVWETASTAWDHDARLLNVVARLYPEINVILCGPLDVDRHASILADHPNVHAIVRGEYDKQIAHAIRFQRGAILPPALLTKAEMDASPPPMWDAACFDHYWDACPAGQQWPQLQLWTSRGCYHKCIFCVWPAVMTGDDPDGTRKRTVRCMDPEAVRRNITTAMAEAAAHGVEFKSIYLDDDTFNLTDKHAVGISAVMKDIGLPWSAMCRADTIKPETWAVMRESGCFGVKLGFESGSQFVIDEIVNKKLDLKKAETETLPLLQSLGFTVHTTWTVGLPGETEAHRKETHAMIARLYAAKLHQTHQMSGAADHPGTPLHEVGKGKALKVFPGAHVDSDYKPSGDGQRKAEAMAKEGRKAQ